jgi:hypothetical protein
METPEETALPDANADLDTVEPVTVDINGVESEVEGEATISRVGESLMVSLQLEELTGAGPFRAQILSGRCEDRENVANQPSGTPGTDAPATTTPPGTTTPGAADQAQGQVLATLEPVQLTGATPPPAGGTAASQAGMSHSTIPVIDLQSATQAFIEVQGEGARTVACGNIDNLTNLLAGGTGGATMSPPAAPSTTPGAAPGTRP